MGEVRLTLIQDIFGDGGITILAVAHKSGFCFEANGVLAATITIMVLKPGEGAFLASLLTSPPPSPQQVEVLARRSGISPLRAEELVQIAEKIRALSLMQGTPLAQTAEKIRAANLLPIVTIDRTDVDVDLDWYCLIAIWVVAGGIVAIVTDLLVEAIDGILNKIADMFIEGLKLPLDPVSGSDRIILNDSKISPEGLTLFGTLPSITLPAQTRRSIELSVSISNIEKTVGDTGFFTPDLCPVEVDALPNTGPYPYTEYVQKQTATIQAVRPKLLGRPLTYEWWIASGPNWVALAGAGQTAPVVTSLFPYPLPGGAWVDHPANVSYAVSGQQIEFWNDPADARYSLEYRVKATDPGGRSASASASIPFAGRWIEIGGNYGRLAWQCIDRLLRVLKEERLGAFKEPLDIGPLPEPGGPEIGDQLRGLIGKLGQVDLRAEKYEHLVNDIGAMYGLVATDILTPKPWRPPDRP
jgi:hypothetical protein